MQIFCPFYNEFSNKCQRIDIECKDPFTFTNQFCYVGHIYPLHFISNIFFNQKSNRFIQWTEAIGLIL